MVLSSRVAALFVSTALGMAAYAQDNTSPLYPVPDQSPQTSKDWFTAGQGALKARIAVQPNTGRAKNVILFVGDGMGVSTLTAGRIFEGQMDGKSGEEGALSFETFPYTALVKTYNTDAQVADSAGTASALNTGVKTRIGVINTPPELDHGACSLAPADRLPTLAMLAEKAGMQTGVVSTARLTHATPAAVYAVAANRGWEHDADLPADIKAAGCADIAQQINSDLGGNGLEVALGGGRRSFLPTTGSRFGNGRRADGLDVVQTWLDRAEGASYVTDKASLDEAAANSEGPLLGLFTESHMAFETDREDSEPSLADMTAAAITHLEKKDQGYYLMVEGARIDHAHHGGNAHRALMDVKALSDAVKKATEMVDITETLILVTADHSHVFTMMGYPPRGNPITGVIRDMMDEDRGVLLTLDGKPATTLGYYNGPGAVSGERPSVTDAEARGQDYQQQALIPRHSETHGGEDVALYAIGPWAHLARGLMEQHVIFHIMHHALELDQR